MPVLPVCLVPRSMRALLRSTAMLTTLFWAAPCWSQTCEFAVTGLPSGAWLEAAHSLRQSNLAHNECATLRVHVTHAGAHLILTTRDGRQVERKLYAPEELAPTFQALLVTLEPSNAKTLPAPVESSSSSISSSASTTASSSPRAFQSAGSREQSIPLAAQSDPGAIFALQGGARGGADALFSPVLAGSGSLLLDPWLLGVTSSVEFQYFDLQKHSEMDRKSSAISVGVLVGRRDPLDSLAFIWGTQLQVAALLHEATGDSGAEWRVGAVIGMAYPRTAGTRFRADLGVDLVGTGQRDASITPDWAVTGLVGVEVGGT